MQLEYIAAPHPSVVYLNRVKVQRQSILRVGLSGGNRHWLRELFLFIPFLIQDVEPSQQR